MQLPFPRGSMVTVGGKAWSMNRTEQPPRREIPEDGGLKVKPGQRAVRMTQWGSNMANLTETPGLQVTAGQRAPQAKENRRRAWANQCQRGTPIGSRSGLWQ